MRCVLLALVTLMIAPGSASAWPPRSLTAEPSAPASMPPVVSGPCPTVAASVAGGCYDGTTIYIVTKAPRYEVMRGLLHEVAHSRDGDVDEAERRAITTLTFRLPADTPWRAPAGAPYTAKPGGVWWYPNERFADLYAMCIMHNRVRHAYLAFGGTAFVPARWRLPGQCRAVREVLS